MRFRAVLTLLAVSIVAFSNAFIEKKPPGKAWIPEETDATIEKQQVYNGVQPVVGEVPTDTTPGRAGGPAVDPGAKDALAVGSAAIDEEQVLSEGSKRQGADEPKSRSWLWALVFGALGLGSIFAVRQWANRAIPDPRRERS
jgi:hypothetical protein